MKPITKERLLKVHQTVSSRQDKQCKYGMSLMSQFATIGISTMSGHDTKASVDKVSLELNYKEIPLTKEAVEAIFDDTLAIADHYRTWRDRINDIQLANNISGLELTDFALGHINLTLLMPDEDKLPLIPSDLDILKLQKSEIQNAWLDVSILRGYSFYREMDNEGWVEISVDSIASLVELYDWVDLFDFNSELHVRFLNGLDYQSRDIQSVSLCASRRMPSI